MNKEEIEDYLRHKDIDPDGRQLTRIYLKTGDLLINFLLDDNQTDELRGQNKWRIGARNNFTWLTLDGEEISHLKIGDNPYFQP